MADLKEYHLDEEGFLEKPETWDPGFSEWLAASEGVELTEAHRELILATREFYDLYHFSPSMRPLIKLPHNPGSKLIIPLSAQPSPAQPSQLENNEI